MSTTPTSSTGSDGSISSGRWTLPRKGDTTPEFADIQERWWMGLTGAERVEWWRRRQYLFASNRFNQVAARNPGATHGELMALWTEETYRESLAPAVLARFCTLLREHWDGQS